MKTISRIICYTIYAIGLGIVILIEVPLKAALAILYIVILIIFAILAPLTNQIRLNNFWDNVITYITTNKFILVTIYEKYYKCLVS